MPKPPIPRRAGGKACNSKLLVLWDRERTCWALQSDSETMASLSNLAMFVGVLIVLLSCIVTADTSGWDLREYEHCKKVDTTGVAGAVNDVTYSPITNSLWMLALGSSVELVEYSMEGYRLRDMGVVDGGLHKPQGISWMHDYTFAVVDENPLDPDDSEGDDHRTSVTILEASPWRANVRIVKRVSFRKVSGMINGPLGSLSYDISTKLLVVGNSDENGMQLVSFDPETGSTRRILEGAEGKGNLLDIAATYRTPGEDGLYILSQNSRHVVEIDAAGHHIAHQGTTVTGDEPRGLTFTPEGNLMIVAGKDRLDFYTRTSSCHYIIPHFLPSYGRSGGKVEFPAEGSSDSSGSDELPWFENTEAGYCGHKSCDASRTGNGYCSSSAWHCVLSCGGAWCPLEGNADPVTSATLPARPLVGSGQIKEASSEETNVSEKVENGDSRPTGPSSRNQGFMAYLNVTVTGMFTKDERELEFLRAAVAKEIYGDSEAMSLVFAMDDGKFDLQNPGRRLTEHPWNMGEATLVMLAETHAHAELLIAKLEVAIGSGSLKRTLHSNGLTHVESLEAGGWEVIGADMAPKFFPVSQSEDPEERLPALMMAHGTTGRKIGWWVFGIAMFVLAANLVIGFIAVRYSRKMKKADEMRDRILGGAKSSV